MDRKRISIIDEIRGLLIILVVIYHTYYNLAVIFRYREITETFRVLRFWQPILPLSFIVISGISFSLSRNNLARGLKLLAVSLAMSAAVAIFMPSQMIWFGIIHFLAVCNILCSFIGKYIDRIPAAVGLIACAVLFVMTYNVQFGKLGVGEFSIALPDFLYQTDLTMIFGFHTRGFLSSDYNPLLPWFFAFIFGMILGRYAKKLPEFLCKKHIPPLAFIGRHTLIIYLAHQPIIVGVMYLINGMKI